MGRLLTIAVIAVMLVGCSDNQLEVKNISGFTIILNFRAEEFTIASNGPTETIKEIPNGTYDYTTIYASSAEDQVVPGSGLTGNITFQRSDTRALLIYGSAVTETDSNGVRTHTLWGQLSTDQPAGVITAP